MRLYEARLVLKSPAIVTLRRTERGYVKPSSSIPGSTLRGAILTALYRQGALNRQNLEKEAREPTLLASTALPVANGRRTVPATPFMAVCKLCGYSVNLTMEAAGALASGREPQPPLYCPEDGGPLEPLHGRFVYEVNGRLRTFSPRTFRATSVGISKERSSALKGLLFDYEALTEGCEFWAWVAAPEGFQLPARMEVAVGRGQSRGFGWSELSLRPVEAGSLPERGVFVALSPVAPLSSVAWGESELKLSRLVGRRMSAQLGWDVLSGKPRPLVKLAKPGSFLVAEHRGSPAAIRAGLPVQVFGSWVVGLNSVVSLDEYGRLVRGL